MEWNKEEAVLWKSMRRWKVVRVRRTDTMGIDFFAVYKGDVDGADELCLHRMKR